MVHKLVILNEIFSRKLETPQMRFRPNPVA
jgi:hypothetical protein